MFQGCRNLCSHSIKLQSKIHSQCMSVLSKTEAKKRRNMLFDEEKRKQRSAVGRIEKIEVKYQTPLEEVVLIMNKSISTPHDCARHISEGVTKVSALALVDGNVWEMHKPLESNCELQLLHMKNPMVNTLNVAFWRTCSFMLGAVIDSAFKDDVKVHLHSFPSPNLKSGSFTYDACLDLAEWKPSNAELQAMSAAFVKLSNHELPVERLETTETMALEMFEDNPYKSEQIPDIAKSNNNIVTLYRIGDHIDISKGPMVGNTNIIGRCTIAAVHKVKSEETEEHFYRFQGVALPRGIILNHFAYSILESYAKKLNTSMWMPQRMEEEENVTIASKM